MDYIENIFINLKIYKLLILSLYCVECPKGEKMKKMFFSLFSSIIFATAFSACAAKVEKKVDEPYYDRANQAAEKAHDKLDKE